MNKCVMKFLLCSAVNMQILLHIMLLLHIFCSVCMQKSWKLLVDSRQNYPVIKRVWFFRKQLIIWFVCKLSVSLYVVLSG